MREKPGDRDRINHMLDAIDSIEKYTEGISYRDFCEDEMMQFALIKHLEIIGEAAYCITKDFQKKITDIDWKMIIDFRHVLVHHDYQIKMDVIWKTIENNIPKLKKNLRKITGELTRDE